MCALLNGANHILALARNVKHFFKAGIEAGKVSSHAIVVDANLIQVQFALLNPLFHLVELLVLLIYSHFEVLVVADLLHHSRVQLVATDDRWPSRILHCNCVLL